MITDHTPETLRAFEADVAAEFNAGLIRAPVHLSGGNEAPLIEIFQRIRPRDWVLTTWRSHYHCLLKGVPEDCLIRDIRNGHSITLNYPEFRVVSSAIVAGICPIAVGLGLSIARARDAYEGMGPAVWCFVGDMAAETGSFMECAKYALAHDLPVRFVVESNEKSVGTPTSAVWGRTVGLFSTGNVTRYRYELPWPHAGAGTHVSF